MAGCLEDLSPTVTEDSGERLLADNEWGKIKTIHRKVKAVEVRFFNF